MAGSDIPRDCLLHIFSFFKQRSECGGTEVPNIAERLRAAAVCRHWRRSLETFDDTIPAIVLTDKDSLAFWDWLISKQPPVSTLVLQLGAPDRLARLPELLARCLGRTKTLWYQSRLPIDQALPQPHTAAPRLQRLKCTLDAASPVSCSWLPTPGQLQALRQLELSFVQYARGPAELPTCSCLTSLMLDIRAGASAFHIASQPALLRLDVWSNSPVQLASTAAAAAAGAAAGGAGGDGRGLPLAKGAGQEQAEWTPSEAPAFPRLQELRLAVFRRTCTLDFRCMPQLRSAWLHLTRELCGPGAPTLAACPRVQQLSLAYNAFEPCPWVLGLLRALPPSVRGLRLEGSFEPELSEVLEEAGGLQALHLCCSLGIAPPACPAVGAPLWRELRALHWDMGVAPLPEELRAATNLERLSAALDEVSERELQLLASLPCLKHLQLPVLRACKGGKAGAQEALDRLQAALPEVLVSSSGSI